MKHQGKKKRSPISNIRDPYHDLVTLYFIIFNSAYAAREQQYSRTKPEAKTILCKFEPKKDFDFNQYWNNALLLISLMKYAVEDIDLEKAFDIFWSSVEIGFSIESDLEMREAIRNECDNELRGYFTKQTEQILEKLKLKKFTLIQQAIEEFSAAIVAKLVISLERENSKNLSKVLQSAFRHIKQILSGDDSDKITKFLNKNISVDRETSPSDVLLDELLANLNAPTRITTAARMHFAELPKPNKFGHLPSYQSKSLIRGHMEKNNEFKSKKKYLTVTELIEVLISPVIRQVGTGFSWLNPSLDPYDLLSSNSKRFILECGFFDDWWVTLYSVLSIHYQTKKGISTILLESKNSSILFPSKVSILIQAIRISTTLAIFLFSNFYSPSLSMIPNFLIAKQNNILQFNKSVNFALNMVIIFSDNNITKGLPIILLALTFFMPHYNKTTSAIIFVVSHIISIMNTIICGLGISSSRRDYIVGEFLKGNSSYYKKSSSNQHQPFTVYELLGSIDDLHKSADIDTSPAAKIKSIIQTLQNKKKIDSAGSPTASQLRRRVSVINQSDLSLTCSTGTAPKHDNNTGQSRADEVEKSPKQKTRGIATRILQVDTRAIPEEKISIQGFGEYSAGRHKYENTFLQVFKREFKSGATKYFVFFESPSLSLDGSSTYQVKDLIYNALTYSNVKQIMYSKGVFFKIPWNTMRPKKMRSLAYRLHGTKNVYVIHWPKKHEEIDRIIFNNCHPESVSVHIDESTGEPKIINNQPGSRR